MNSVLFDFYSLIDRDLSAIKYIKEEYGNSISIFDNDKIMNNSDTDWKILRTNEHMKSIISDDNYKDNFELIINDLYDRDINLILPKYKFLTDLNKLLRMYRTVGNGKFVSISVQCESDIERMIIEELYPDVSIVQSNRNDIDIAKYGRVYVGCYKHALQYTFSGPVNICILDFADNFWDNAKQILRPEFIVQFGDIHDISVATAYDLNINDLKGT